MKLNILLSLGLCLSIFLTSCNDDDAANPPALQVTMHSSSQTLVEGGEAVEVTVELNREYNEVKYLYLDYGSSSWERATFFEEALKNEGILVKVQDQDLWVLRIPFLPGERRKVIRLHALENDLYRGNRPLALKVLSYEQGRGHYEAEMKLNFEEKTPKPIFGILDSKAVETMVIDSKDVVIDSNDDSTEKLMVPITVSGRFQFPQTIHITYSGTAKSDSDYKKLEETVTIMPNDSPDLYTRHYWLLGVYINRDFSTPKTVQITLSEAEEGEIANGQEFEDQTGEKLILKDTFTLTITE